MSQDQAVSEALRGLSSGFLVTLDLGAGSSVRGLFERLVDGTIVLSTSEGPRTVAAGDVEHIRIRRGAPL